MLGLEIAYPQGLYVGRQGAVQFTRSAGVGDLLAFANARLGELAAGQNQFVSDQPRGAIRIPHHRTAVNIEHSGALVVI